MFGHKGLGVCVCVILTDLLMSPGADVVEQPYMATQNWSPLSEKQEKNLTGQLSEVLTGCLYIGSRIPVGLAVMHQ